MSDPFTGEIKMFAGNFAPRGYAFCDGQLLAVSQNDALFSLVGTIYGGDGRTTFGLPDLRGRIPIHAGNGPGLTSRTLGQKSGSEMATVSNASMVPAHTHALQGVGVAAGSRDPAGNLLAVSAGVTYAAQGPDGDMLTGAVLPGAAAQAHANVQPFLCINFIIAIFGTYPSQN